MNKKRIDIDRVLLFRKGFKDGSSCSVIKYEDELDYLEGYKQGRKLCNKAVKIFRKKNKLKKGSILKLI